MPTLILESTFFKPIENWNSGARGTRLMNLPGC
jgi:hypothetical protein